MYYVQYQGQDYLPPLSARHNFAGTENRARVGRCGWVSIGDSNPEPGIVRGIDNRHPMILSEMVATRLQICLTCTTKLARLASSYSGSALLFTHSVT